MILLHGHVLERLAHDDLAVARQRGVVQEPADQHEPQAVEDAAGEVRHGQPERDARRRSRRAPARGPGRRSTRRGWPAHAAGRAPEDRAQDAAAVEREAGDQVEEPEHHVHRTEPQEDGRHRRQARRGRAARSRVEAGIGVPRPATAGEAGEAEEHAHGGPASAITSSARPRARLALDVGEAAEQEQRDPGDAEAREPRDDRVRQLVQRGSTRRRRARRRPPRPSAARAPVGVPRRQQPLGEPEAQERRR